MTILIKQNTHIQKNNNKTLEIMVKLKSVVKKEREKKMTKTTLSFDPFPR